MKSINNPLIKLQSIGQSIWLDYLRRNFIDTGELQKLIDEDGLRGLTSNPSIFEKAIAGSHDYDQAIQKMALAGDDVNTIYQVLTVEDVQAAADCFRPVFERSKGEAGFVSLEISPHLAHDTKRTVAEARRLWKALDRPNVMIKVPGTKQGLPAIEQLISEGININITLLFSIHRYEKVADAFITGLENRRAQGKPIGGIFSVASFFISRIDSLIDPILEKVYQTGAINSKTYDLLHGEVGVSSAKVAYQQCQKYFKNERFNKLASDGANSQKLLWASTSTKNPHYSDVKYVEALIGKDTVNTIPVETLNAYRDHGKPEARLGSRVEIAEKVLSTLKEVGIDLDGITQQLEDEGAEKFNKSYDRIMETLKKEQLAALQERKEHQKLELGNFESSFEKRIASLEKNKFQARFWRKDAGLWKKDIKDQKNIRDKMGWLHIVEKMEENIREIYDFTNLVDAAGFRHVVHMGMGGSSLAPLVFERSFPLGDDSPPLTVLDTTDPATILNVEHAIPIADTLFIVASKSGTTAEPLAFCDYFYNKVRELRGSQAGENFIAITDPGTPLVELARERQFRHVFRNFEDIGGRYSALSFFGLVPAALMGVDIAELLERALRNVYASASCVDLRKNPGMSLGVALGELGLQGRNKVTILAPDHIATFGMWLEQLLAESTGKEGKGLLPVEGEPLGDPMVYGQDRFFIRLLFDHHQDKAAEQAVEALRKNGHPVATIRIDELLDLGEEFFRWEVATATAGSILGINAFDQPNVQESKDNTNRLLKVVNDMGYLPEEEPSLVEEPIRLYGQNPSGTIKDTLAQFLAQEKPGDYIAIMAYISEKADSGKALRSIRLKLRDHYKLATTLGYGPRFLHSTGQFHKGGPNNGLFLQLTADDNEDIDVPGQKYSFGLLKQAQALGDLEALRKHGRRVMRIHLGPDVLDGLTRLDDIIKKVAT